MEFHITIMRGGGGGGGGGGRECSYSAIDVEVISLQINFVRGTRYIIGFCMQFCTNVSSYTHKHPVLLVLKFWGSS